MLFVLFSNGTNVLINKQIVGPSWTIPLEKIKGKSFLECFMKLYSKICDLMTNKQIKESLIQYTFKKSLKKQ